MKLKKTIIVLVALTAISKVLGLIRDISITSYVGFGKEVDSIILALSIPVLMSSIFFTIFRTTFPPIFSKLYQEDPLDAKKSFINIKKQLIIIIIIFFTFAYIFRDNVIKILSPGLSNEVFELVVYYFDFSIILILLFSIHYLIISFLNSIKIFYSTEISGILNNIVIILFIYFFYNKIGNISLIYAYIIGAFVQLICSYLIYRKRTIKIDTKIKINFKSKESKTFYTMSKYIIFSSIIAQMTVFSDKFVGSFLSDGSITALHYANILKNLPITIIVLAISTVFYPNMAIKFKENDKKTFITIINEQIFIMMIILIYFSLIFMFFNLPIVDLLFNRGNFNDLGIQMISNSLFVLSFALLVVPFKEVFTKTLFAIGDTKTPMLIAIISLVVNLLLNFYLGLKYDYVGITISTFISFFLNTVILYFVLKKKIKFKVPKFYFVKLIFFVVINIFILFVLKYSFNLNSFDLNLKSFIAFSAFSVIYVVIAMLYFKKNIRNFN